MYTLVLAAVLSAVYGEPKSIRLTRYTRELRIADLLPSPQHERKEALPVLTLFCLSAVPVCLVGNSFLQPRTAEEGVAMSASMSSSPGERRLRLMQPAAISVPCQSVEDFEAQSLDLVLRTLRSLLDENPFKQLVVGLSGTKSSYGTNCHYAYVCGYFSSSQPYESVRWLLH